MRTSMKYLVGWTERARVDRGNGDRHRCIPELLIRLRPAVEPDGATFVSHGARLSLSSDDPHVLEQMARVLPGGSRPKTLRSVDARFAVSGRETAEGGGFRLSLNSTELQSSSNFEDLLDRFESELHFQVAVHSRHSLFVHAGVVGWQGRAILIPGRSRTGKTSLVAALALAGAEYYSDE